MTQELIEIPGKWDLPWRYGAGEVGTIYINALKNEGKIMGTQCPQCKQIIVPPRYYCEKCFVSLRDHWVELPLKARLMAFTIVTEPFEGAPKPPYVNGWFKIGDAATNIPGFLVGLDLSDPEQAQKKIKPGMPVKVVFKPKAERVGGVQDFYYEPL